MGDSMLGKELLEFSKEDVRLMQQMLARFHEFHEGTGLPDWSESYAAYLPVFAISMLASQKRMEKLTRVLIGLTLVLLVLTIVLAFQSFLLL